MQALKDDIVSLQCKMKFVVIANSLAGLARTKRFTDVDNCVVAVIKTDK